MEFRQALNDLIINKKISLLDDDVDKKVLVAYSSLYCKENRDFLQMQELKNILSTNKQIGKALYQAYIQSKNEKDTSFKKIAETIEDIANELENNGISCFSYSYFLSCYLDVFAVYFNDSDLKKAGIESIDFIDPEKYDYTYENMPAKEKTFGFGRYYSSIKDFKIESGRLIKYNGKDPYVIVPNFVKVIGNGAFIGNKKLKSVYLPKAILGIEDSAFKNCEKLETIVLSEKISTLPSSAFENCVLLKRINLDNIEKVSDKCFKNCTMLEKVKLPLLSKVGKESFYNCSSIKDWSFISNLTEIDDNAFEKCSMSYVSLEKCRKLGAYSFSDCTSIERIAISSNSIRVSSSPFKRCQKVSLINISNNGYKGYLYKLFANEHNEFVQNTTQLKCVKMDNLKTGEFENHSFIEEVEIRNVSKIPDKAFENCENLTTVIFSKDISIIGDNAFSCCFVLKDLQLNFIGEKIGNKAFYKCYKVPVDIILEKAKEVGDFAFAYTDVSKCDFKNKFRYIGAFAFANAKFPERVSLDFRNCQVLPGAFHGVREILILNIDSPNVFYLNKLHLVFDKDAKEFANNTSISHLLIDGDITDNAFEDYCNVRHITFEEKSEKIPSEAFKNCHLLESVTVKGKVSKIGSEAFLNCRSLSLLDIDGKEITVEKYAFAGCNDVQSLLDVKCVSRFMEYSFAKTDIEKLELSKDTKYIGYSAFSECNKINKVSLPFLGNSSENENNKYFGTIFSKEETENCNVQEIKRDGKTIRYYIPKNINEITVQDSVLDFDSFDGCQFLKKVYCTNVVSFDARSLENCIELEEIFLGSSLKTFVGDPFADGRTKAKIKIDPLCEDFVSIDGTVLSKDKQILFYLDREDSFKKYSDNLSTIKTGAVKLAPSKVDLNMGIKNISSRAFDFKGVDSVIINGEKRIEKNAFYNCDDLLNIKINKAKVQEIFDCEQNHKYIERISLSNGNSTPIKGLFTNVEEIAIDSIDVSNISLREDIFQDVSKINNFEILTSVSLDNPIFTKTQLVKLRLCAQNWKVKNLFKHDYYVDEISLYDRSISSGEFDGLKINTLKLDNIKSIAKNAFENATINHLIINGAEYIDINAFKNSNVSSIEIEAKDYSIVDGVLYNKDTLVYCFDKSIQTFIVPQFVRFVMGKAFDNVSGLREFKILHSDISFEKSAIVNCKELSDFECTEFKNNYLWELFDNASYIKTIKFNGKNIKRKFFSRMTGVQDISLNGVEKISEMAFYENTSLKNVNGLENVISIGDMAFARCSSLKNVTISDKCKRLGLGTFEGCLSLEKLTYPIDKHQLLFNLKFKDILGELGKSSQKVVISGGEEIPSEYFVDVKTQISILNSPDSIEEKAFKNSNLDNISLEKTSNIGREAFYGTKISCAEMPKIINIKESVFENCSSLKKVVINNDIEQIDPTWLNNTQIEMLSGAENGKNYRTLNNCLIKEKDASLIFVSPKNPVVDLSFDDKVQKIRRGAFKNSNVKSLDISKTDYIEKEAFEDCSFLENLKLKKIDNKLDYYFGDNKTLKCVSVEKGGLAEECFKGLEKLEKVNLTSEVYSIGKRCFEDCTSLISINNMQGIKSIGEYAFLGCKSIKTITLPFIGIDESNEKPLSYLFGEGENALECVTVQKGSLSLDAFSGWEKIKTINLPDNINRIPNACFKNCKSLTKVNGFYKVKAVGEEAFLGCSSIASLDCNGLVKIDNKAFYECVALQSVELNSIESIGKDAFNLCKSIESVKFGDLLTTISERAFANCISLKQINIPNQLEELGDYAFLGTSMKKVEMRMPRTLTSVGEYIFKNAHSPIVYVYPNQTSTWNPNWSLGCIGHGLFKLSKRVITKKYKSTEVENERKIP